LSQIETAVIETPRWAFVAMSSLSHRLLAESHRNQEISLRLGYSALEGLLCSREEIGGIASLGVTVNQAAVGGEAR
jgi:hypothetical protein